MDVMEAVETIEAPEIESSEDLSNHESGGEHQEEQQTDDPYAPKGSREYSQWLKAQQERLGDDPNSKKFLRLSKDNHARLYQLQQLEPRGIDGIRERYAAVDSVVHGELKGVEAINALQDELRGVQEIDGRLLAGDATALRDLGEDFTTKSLPQLAGPILDMVRENNPEAYSKAVLPHFVDALKSSDLVRDFNGMIDVLNQVPPAYLTADQKQAWAADQLKNIMGLAGNMGKWLNAQATKAGELPKPGVQTTKPGQTDLSPEQKELEERRKGDETAHWQQNITPKLDAHADKRFDELMRPFDKRLRLSKEARADLKQAVVQGVTAKAKANKGYVDQIGRYHATKKADPATVVNYAKVEFDKHAETTLKALVTQRYGSFLNGKPANGALKPVPGSKTGPVAPGVQIVSVKPKNIDFKATPLGWLHEKKYKTTDGKVVQWRPVD